MLQTKVIHLFHKLSVRGQRGARLAQPVEDGGEELGVAVDEDEPLVVPGQRVAPAEQRLKECAFELRERAQQRL